MLKIISSKNDSAVYKLAKEEKNKWEKNAEFKTAFSDLEIEVALGQAENISIFGDKNAYIIRITREDQLENISKQLLETLEKSEHFFVLIGAGSDFDKQVLAAGKKVLKIEEKKVFDFPAEMVAALQKHDKKNSWYLLLKELENKDAEPIHGSCIFAYKSLLVYLNDPKNNSPLSGVKDYTWKQASVNAKLGKRLKEEVQNKYFNLVMAYHKARNGEQDLKTQLEKWVLDN